MILLNVQYNNKGGSVMDSLGFYKPTNKEGLDLIEFLAKNFEGFGYLISSENSPEVIIGDLSPVDPTGLRPIQYCEEGVEFRSSEDSSLKRVDNVLIIDEVRAAELFIDQLNEGNLTNILMGLWQTTFHELRHFIQCKKMAKQSKYFFSAEILDTLDRLNPGISEPARSHIAVYESYVQDEYTLSAEVDAVISSLLTLMHFMHIYDDESNSFDPLNVVKALMLTKHQFQNNPSWLCLEPK